MKAYACVGSHNKIFYCESSLNDLSNGILRIYRTRKDAERFSILPQYVREVTITIHRKKESR